MIYKARGDRVYKKTRGRCFPIFRSGSPKMARETVASLNESDRKHKRKKRR